MRKGRGPRRQPLGSAECDVSILRPPVLARGQRQPVLSLDALLEIYYCPWAAG